MHRTKQISHIISRATLLCLAAFHLLVLFSSCSDYKKDDYKDNSPTSGKLKLFYDEGLSLHVKNQVVTFESQYPRASVELYATSENEAVQALYQDSCEAIVISRLLNEKEAKIFASKQYTPGFSAVAKSGVALITNIHTPVETLSYEQVSGLLQTENYTVSDSSGQKVKLQVLFDKKNSAVLHYMVDSVLNSGKLSSNCNSLNSSLETINYVAANKNTIAFIDFAWLSDSDDSIYKANTANIKFIAVSRPASDTYEFPSQSSFKLSTYPFTRTVYVMRKTGNYTLAKGLESFVAGPKGQLTFLKQGLLPTRQAERAIQINTESKPDKSQ